MTKKVKRSLKTSVLYGVLAGVIVTSMLSLTVSNPGTILRNNSPKKFITVSIAISIMFTIIFLIAGENFEKELKNIWTPEKFKSKIRLFLYRVSLFLGLYITTQLALFASSALFGFTEDAMSSLREFTSADTSGLRTTMLSFGCLFIGFLLLSSGGGGRK